MNVEGLRACPRCGALNRDNWPLKIGGEIVDGGCQLCWEAECSRSWWEMVTQLQPIIAAEYDSGERERADHG